jgi:hypothetical protein
MSTTVLRRPPVTDRGLRTATQLLEVNAERGTATVRVDLGKVTEATVPVVRAARLAVNALMGPGFRGAPTWIGHQSHKELPGRSDARPEPSHGPRLPRHRTASLARGTAV